MAKMEYCRESWIVVHDPPCRCVAMDENRNNISPFSERAGDLPGIVLRSVILKSARSPATVDSIHIEPVTGVTKQPHRGIRGGFIERELPRKHCMEIGSLNDWVPPRRRSNLSRRSIGQGRNGNGLRTPDHLSHQQRIFAICAFRACRVCNEGYARHEC